AARRGIRLQRSPDGARPAMNDLGFDIDETDFDAQSRGVGVAAARQILLACFTKLVDEALAYHTLVAEADAWWKAYHIRMQQRPDETLHEWFGRTWEEMWSAQAEAPEPAQSGVRNTTG